MKMTMMIKYIYINSIFIRKNNDCIDLLFQTKTSKRRTTTIKKEKKASKHVDDHNFTHLTFGISPRWQKTVSIFLIMFRFI